MITGSLATSFTFSTDGMGWALFFGVPAAAALVVWLQVLTRRWALWPTAVSLALLCTAAALWLGSPLFEMWYQGRNLIGAAELSVGIVLLAAGVGASLTAVRSRSRTARALGFAFGSLFAGLIAYHFTRMAVRVYNVDGVELAPMTPVLLSFAAYPLGWAIWLGAAYTLSYRGRRYPQILLSRFEPDDNRYRWPVLVVILGGVALAGGLGFLFNLNHYETFKTPRGNWTPHGLAYLNQMRFETLWLLLMPAVMGFSAWIGTREKLRVDGWCAECGYSLRGRSIDSTTAGLCPECGALIS